MENIVSTAQMEALKALSDMNLKVSEVRAELSELETMKEAFIVSREKEVSERIDALLQESRETIKETVQNYQDMKSFHKEVSTFADILRENKESFVKLVDSFEESKELWSKQVEEQENALIEAKKTLTVDRVKIENDRKSIESARKELERATRKLESDRGTIDRKIARLKANKI